MSVSKEAVEVALDGWFGSYFSIEGEQCWQESTRADRWRRDMEAALTAALPHLAQPSKSDAKWHDNAVNGALRKALAVMVVRQGKLEEAEAAKGAEIAALRERTRLPTAQTLARAIFDNGGCSEQRCAWGERPCDCQERGEVCALIALRALAALDMSGGVNE